MGEPTQGQIDAVGKLTEALETVERARGHLYSFHQLTGTADLMLDDAVDGLAGAGEPELASWVKRELVGRNVLPGTWTFEVVEGYDDLYYRPFQDVERGVRERVLDGARHVHEAELKQRRRAHREAEPDGR
ncbi:MAG TPA: hypothetical protein VGH99_12700 [Pseudonocardia sp.]|jgi:hypothetical protein